MNADVETIDMILEHFAIDRSEITEVVCGMARGIDLSGKAWADHYGIHVEPFPADWNGPRKKGAGRYRNGLMADYADELLLIWTGESNGSAHMKEEMEDRLKTVYEITL